MAGGSIYDVGHASVAFTAAVYRHLSGDHRVKESDGLSFTIPSDATAKVLPFESRSEAESEAARTHLVPAEAATLVGGG